MKFLILHYLKSDLLCNYKTMKFSADYVLLVKFLILKCLKSGQVSLDLFG